MLVGCINTPRMRGHDDGRARQALTAQRETGAVLTGSMWELQRQTGNRWRLPTCSVVGGARLMAWA
jgi:hypothetical protein